MLDLLEKLAALEHEQWMAWASAVFPEVSEARARRWSTLFVPYEQLSEASKEQDREWARKVLKVIEEVNHANG